MAHHSSLIRIVAYGFLHALFVSPVLLSAELPPEKPLWSDPAFTNVIHYDVKEVVRINRTGRGSLSGSNRVFSFIAEPTYCLHAAAKTNANGVGLVICPGGGYREVWLDREGHDLALWLKPRGVTSLVLKYRTNNGGPGEEQKYPWESYLPAVFADARQAVRFLRAHAAELNLDPNKIGICGFSAGGNLAFNTVFRPETAAGAHPVSGEANFAGLFYPWLREEFGDMVANTRPLPPLFVMNAIDDTLTPVKRCVEFSQAVLNAGGRIELHLYTTGGHGFDMGDGHGESAALWKESFVAWLKDCGFIR